MRAARLVGGAAGHPAPPPGGDCRTPEAGHVHHRTPHLRALEAEAIHVFREVAAEPGKGREGRWAGTDKLECGLHVVQRTAIA